MRPRLSQWDQSGASDGDAPVWSSALGMWVPSSSSGGGSVTFTGELLMQDGVTAPPVPLENEARDDWLYEG